MYRPIFVVSYLLIFQIYITNLSQPVEIGTLFFHPGVDLETFKHINNLMARQKHKNNLKARQKVIEKIESFDLIDVWREFNDKKRNPTKKSSSARPFPSKIEFSNLKEEEITGSFVRNRIRWNNEGENAIKYVFVIWKTRSV